MPVSLFLDSEQDLPLVPSILAETGEEFCLSRRVDAEMISQCCRLGYLPMADEFRGRPLLLIKCHHARMLLYFSELRRARRTLRRMQREEFHISVDTSFERVLDETNRYHRRSWLTSALGEALLDLHRNPRKGVSVHSVELITGEGELVAAELGYRSGRAYTSLSGFHLRSGAGSIQLVALASVLRRAGFAFWDLGMDIPYKRNLGARPVGRTAFLEEYRRAAAEDPPAFPVDPVKCRTLCISEEAIRDEGIRDEPR